MPRIGIAGDLSLGISGYGQNSLVESLVADPSNGLGKEQGQDLLVYSEELKERYYAFLSFLFFSEP